MLHTMTNWASIAHINTRAWRTSLLSLSDSMCCTCLRWFWCVFRLSDRSIVCLSAAADADADLRLVGAPFLSLEKRNACKTKEQQQEKTKQSVRTDRMRRHTVMGVVLVIVPHALCCVLLLPTMRRQ